MGLLEPITHKDEIEDILSQAQRIQNNSINRFNSAKANAEKALDTYGKTKIEIYSGSISDFLDSFKTFKNVQMKELFLSENQLINVDSDQALVNIEENVKYPFATCLCLG